MSADSMPASSAPIARVSTPAGITEAPRIVGQSQAIRDLLAELQRLAYVDARVLITGESGVGKELVASYIHACSPRASRPFVPLNCAGVPETLLESELFGHVKGSFTGAYRDKPGKFELAHTGTLFLDEVGEMSLRMQGLLLRVLETGELQKVGTHRPSARVNCRVISATNRNLPEMIERGLLREDLYYRLNVIHVHVPPLRDRAEDVPLLIDALLARMSSTSSTPPLRFAPEVIEALRAYDWPGNVRQLENVVQRLVVNRHGDAISLGDLPTELRRHAPPMPREVHHERRRAVAEEMHQRIRLGASFWEAVWRPYMYHDITRADVRELVRRGLVESRGNYRVLTRLFNIEPSDYKRLMSFLRKHQCLLPYRDFR
jgi:transcriptional regulator with PAS, ATPase and Fis domain